MKLYLSMFILLVWVAPFIKAQANMELDQPPYFSGCDEFKDGSDEKLACSNENLVVFIADFLNYPEAAKLKGVEGTVYVEFTIDSLGKVKDAKVLRDIGADCGEEALRVVSNLPTWQPAMKNGHSISVSMRIPIAFKLNNEKEENAFSITWAGISGQEVDKYTLRKALKEPLLVRDEAGNEVFITELTFSYRKRDRIRSASSRNGEFNRAIEKLVRRSRSGGALVIMTLVQKNAKFYEVERIFSIVK